MTSRPSVDRQERLPTTVLERGEQQAAQAGDPAGSTPRSPSWTSTPTRTATGTGGCDVDGDVATLMLAVDEDGGLVPATS